MLRFLLKAKARKQIAAFLLIILGLPLVLPQRAAALTSGPVQPEAQSFEPVGTTDMVDPFTGDFVYNIPLLDVEGYPINISYHGGVNMEQEASWVGLGWNINPGAVNRQMRGLPDDFDGDTVEKEFYVKPDTTIRLGLAGGVEYAGVGDPYIDINGELGGYVNFNNYRGVSVDFTANGGVNLNYGIGSGGFNFGAAIGSQSGAAINYGASIGVGSPRSSNSDLTGSLNANIGGNYNPRSGIRNSWGLHASAAYAQERREGSSSSSGVSVPIGGFNQYSPVVTNASYMNSYQGQLKLGIAVYSAFINGKVSASMTELHYDTAGHRKGYGYLNLHNSDKNSLLDFQREKDGNWNGTMKNLPQTHLAYDVYSVSGQGTGGSFRPFRNDIGSVYDPITETSQESEDATLEVGVPWLFSLGGEFTKTSSSSKSGPWDHYYRPFVGPQKGTYEDVYFKEAGEITQNNESYLGQNLPGLATPPSSILNLDLKKPASNERVVRGNYIYPISGSARDAERLLDTRQLQSYTDTDGFAHYPVVGKTAIDRTNGTSGIARKPSQVSEIVQIQKDGRRYVYGLPVLNNVQREVTFAVNKNAITENARSTYQIGYTPGQDDKVGNGNGTDNFYSSTVTPSFVAAHLLTAVLSQDYSDLSGNGITDDDLGSYTKFNYSRKSDDYRWRSPATSGKAQYNPGFYSDPRDDRGTYVIGSREQWMLHSVETKNYVAEFYVSARLDARGVLDGILGNGPTTYYKDGRYQAAGEVAKSKSYKLDSIVLYNKHDRFLHPSKAQPIKSVIFSYDYSLCKLTPNSIADSGGKLTLRKIQVRYGSSAINMSAAYTFDYSGNYSYNEGAKDRWGNYMAPAGTMNNFEFPFTRQRPETDAFANAWSLSQIGLPSGGIIRVDYEADDYAYVQGRKAAQMFMVKGIGSSPAFSSGSQLYLNEHQPFLYYYFDRQKATENGKISFRENYLADTTIMYYNVAAAIANGKYEPVKGYARITDIGPCLNDTTHGYVKMEVRQLEFSNGLASPVAYTALNLGRYSLPHILFPGADPDASNMDNVAAGLSGSLGELFNLYKNPLKYYMQQGMIKTADLSRSYIRLNSPGLTKKGGGQRVRRIRFFDNWESMAGGNNAVYGKEYFYTIERQDKKGVISSGVASWEPMTGGDENPNRLPAGYAVQQGNQFPPNDPVELYQEEPIGESFFPGGVVGYSRVTSRSINQDRGRSAQSEDVNDFYTAKDFPISAVAGPLDQHKSDGLTGLNILYEQNAEQGFDIVLNDMHGKPDLTRHYIIRTGDSAGLRELVSSQKNEYFKENGRLSSRVPVFDYKPGNGQLKVESRNMGTETDLTLDSRIREDKTKTRNYSANLNGFLAFAIPIAIPVGYGFPFGSVNRFRMATLTKVSQQYGILSKVTTINEGANTELRNEVFDPLTGNVLVTSVNNEFGDRQYTVNFPAHWAYKEMGPAYVNMNLESETPAPIVIDPFGSYASRFVNYNGAYSYSYALPATMPVGRMAVDERMPDFKLGDEMLIYPGGSSDPVRVWVMGYTSDVQHCYAVLATREPYKAVAGWGSGQIIAAGSPYKVVRSGARNRLGETIQSFTTMDSTNIFPYLKNNLTGLISLTAQRLNHNLAQVSAANVISDSINPFVTGKVGIYRPQTEVLNVKPRDYAVSTSRHLGTFNSTSYWKTETDNFPAYCTDSTTWKGRLCNGYIDSIRLAYVSPYICDVTYYVGNYGSQNPCSLQPSRVDAPIGDTTGNGPVINTPVTILYQGVIPPGGHTVRMVDSLIPFSVGQAHTITWINECGCDVRIAFSWNGAGFDGHAYGHTSNSTYVNGYFTNVFNPNGNNNPSLTPYRVQKKILLGKVGHYDGTDDENWVRASQVTKYNWFGAEIENREEGLGYNSAVYGYGQQLPVCVAKNARHGEVLFEGFEDYGLLRPDAGANAGYLQLLYSPFEPFVQAASQINSLYQRLTLQTTSGSNFKFNLTEAHTGSASILAEGNVVIPLDGTATGMSRGYSFSMHGSQKYVASVWVKSATALPAAGQNYASLPKIKSDTSMTGSPAVRIDTLVATTGIIEGWQQFEVAFEVPAGYRHFELLLGSGYYYDDLRIYPFESNSKAFVYHPVTRKLVATLDENNFATLYEYDAEGNLVRTKKETDQGILTISETRSTHRKAH